MRVISVNVGQPRPVEWDGRTVLTGIFKSPVGGRVRMRTLNLDGDRQADLSVHGGPDKAVYAYPSEHYDFWREELPGTDLPWGSFGENLTSEGWEEYEVHIGDRFRIGTAEVVVTQPRMPCFKLGIKLGREDIVPRFLESGRPGFYLRVLEEGEVGAGDAMERIREDPHRVTVVDVVRLYLDRDGSASRDLLERAVRVGALSPAWRERFARRL
ncbi:MAG TPA: MOSC domain-containing protein [Thermoanaerobaculia bacterium]|nr:MOSC domain-containing protein [Thermoanaerobaculia bacterium]